MSDTAAPSARRLRPEHLADLRISGLSDKTIAACSFYSADADEVAAILGFPAGPGLVLPYDPEPSAFRRVKPDRRHEDWPKYMSPRGSGNHLYIPTIVDRAVLA